MSKTIITKTPAALAGFKTTDGDRTTFVDVFATALSPKGEAPAKVSKAVETAAYQYANNPGAINKMQQTIELTKRTNKRTNSRTPAARGTLAYAVAHAMQHIIDTAASAKGRPGDGDVPTRETRAVAYAQGVRAMFEAGLAMMDLAKAAARKAKAPAEGAPAPAAPAAPAEGAEGAPADDADMASPAAADRIVSLLAGLTDDDVAHLAAHPAMSRVRAIIIAEYEAAAAAKGAKVAKRAKVAKVAPVPLAA